jgi:hypothetical protein
MTGVPGVPRVRDVDMTDVPDVRVHVVYVDVPRREGGVVVAAAVAALRERVTRLDGLVVERRTLLAALRRRPLALRVGQAQTTRCRDREEEGKDEPAHALFQCNAQTTPITAISAAIARCRPRLERISCEPSAALSTRLKQGNVRAPTFNQLVARVYVVSPKKKN